MTITVRDSPMIDYAMTPEERKQAVLRLCAMYGVGDDLPEATLDQIVRLYNTLTDRSPVEFCLDPKPYRVTKQQAERLDWLLERN